GLVAAGAAGAAGAESPMIGETAPMRVAALVPAYDEGERIAAVVSGVRPHVDAVIVVDDGSRDETTARARGAGAEVLRHEVNRGKGHAVRTGLAHVLARPFTHVLLMDGDLQHRPDDVPKLVAAARDRGLELVVGARGFDRAKMPAARYYSNVI